MGRPRKPTDYLNLVGSDKKNPGRMKEQGRDREPGGTGGLGEPPARLNEAERARWVEIATACPWAKAPDRVAVEETAKLWQLAIDNKASTAERKLLQSYLIHLGMLPADRSKVQVAGDKKPKTNAFGALTG